MQIKEAVILAGGLGTRLRTVLPDLPKCLAPIRGRPFLGYLTDYLIEQGIERFVFALGYQASLVEQFIETHFSANGKTGKTSQKTRRTVTYQFSVEKELLGTGGAIKLACTRASDDQLIVANGDTFFRINLQELSTAHKEWGADCTLSLKPMQNFDRYGCVQLNSDQSVKNFREKKQYTTGLINGGVYALGRKGFMEASPAQKFSFEKDYLEKHTASRRIFGLVQDTYFIDIGQPEDYNRAQTEMEI